jgi:hypothetical protein
MRAKTVSLRIEKNSDETGAPHSLHSLRLIFVFVLNGANVSENRFAENLKIYLIETGGP